MDGMVSQQVLSSHVRLSRHVLLHSDNVTQSVEKL